MTFRNRSQRTIGRTAIFLTAAVLLFSIPPSTSPAQAQATGASYWICRVTPGDGNSYYSDVFAAPDSSYSDMAKEFAQFLTTWYSQKNGVPTCIHYVSDQQAQTYMKQFAAGPKSILTGWKYGQTTAATGSTASPAPSQSATPATAPTVAPPPAPASQVPVASTTIAMRMVNIVNSATDPPGKQYRAVVTQATTAGSVSIPVNTEARITLAQSGGTWSTQLNALSLNNQWVTVSSTSVSASSPMQQIAQKAKSVLPGLNIGKSVSPSAAVATAIASGDHVFLPEGAVLTFSASVPQPLAQASSASTAATPPPPSAPANTPSPVNAAPLAAGQVSALCEITTPTHTYVSAIFSGDYQNKAKWEIAFSNYIWTNFDKFPGNGGCSTYQSATPNEHMLQSWKSQPSSKLYETGWVYKGPEPGPPPPPHSNNGK